MMIVNASTLPHPYSPSQIWTIRPPWNPTQPNGAIMTNTDTMHEPVTPKIDRVSSECVCPVRDPRYEPKTAYQV